MEPIKVFELKQTLTFTDERTNDDGVKEYENTFNTSVQGDITESQAIDALTILTKVLMNESKVDDPMKLLVPLMSNILDVGVFVVAPEEEKHNAKLSN